MRLYGMILVMGLIPACSKKDEKDEAKLKVMPQLLKLPNTSTTLAPKIKLVSADGVTSQSFTPTSIKISLLDIALEDEAGTATQIYACAAQNVAGCLVEVSKLQDLEDALNATPVSVRAANYVKVLGSFCGTNDDGQQLIEITGSTEFGGKTYITDTTAGIKEGVAADATPVQYRFHGCASTVTLQSPINVELSEEQKKMAAEYPDDPANDTWTKADADVSLRLLFDSYNFAMMGEVTNDSTKELIGYGHSNLDNVAFNDEDDAACKGSKTGLFICAQRTAIYATDAAHPTIDRYAITIDDGGDSWNGKTAIANPGSASYTALVRNDAGIPVAAYTRRSIDYGTEFNRAMQGDEDYIGYGKGIQDNGDGTYRLAKGINYDQVSYPAFKPETHSGTMVWNESEVAYTATKMP